MQEEDEIQESQVEGVSEVLQVEDEIQESQVEGVSEVLHEKDAADEDQASDLLVRKWTIGVKRKLAKENLRKQATKMLRLSNNQFGAASVGDSVRVPVPEVDRPKCASRNIIGVIMEVNHEKSLYKIGTSQGVLSGMFT